MTTDHHTLYFSPQPTRSARARWAYLEAGQAFEAKPIDIFAGEQKTEAYLAVNPLGHVPAAVINGQPITESGALTLLVATEHPERNLLPETGTADWRSALQWIFFAPAELDHHLATLNVHRLLSPPDQRIKAVGDRAQERLEERARHLVAALGDNPYLLGETFSAADIAVGHSIVWARMHNLLVAFPRLQQYLDRLSQRPAFVEVYGPEVGTFPDPFAN